MNGKLLFLITLAAAVLFSAVALFTGANDTELGLQVGLVLAGVWALWLIALLYLAGGAISCRRHPGEAATSILLALLLTPLVVAAPTTALIGSLAAGIGGALSPAEEFPSAPFEEFPPAEEGEILPGAGLSEDDVEAFWLPEGVTRDDLTEDEWADFYSCVTMSPFPEECPIGDVG